MTVEQKNIESTICQILETYGELSDKTKKGILAKTVEIIKENHINSFDRYYEIIAFLVDYHALSNLVSLDACISGRNSLLEFVGATGEVERFFESEFLRDSKAGFISLREALIVLKGNVSKSEIRVLEKIIESAGRSCLDLKMDLTEQQIVENIAEIRMRINAVDNQYGRKNVVAIPKENGVKIYFTELGVRFRKFKHKKFRDYKSAAEYYQAHTELHDFTRSQLKTKDRQLYDKLRYERKIDLVPVRVLSEKEIIDLYYSCDANSNEAEKMCKWSNTTIKKIWAKHNLYGKKSPKYKKI